MLARSSFHCVSVGDGTTILRVWNLLFICSLIVSLLATSLIPFESSALGPRPIWPSLISSIPRLTLNACNSWADLCGVSMVGPVVGASGIVIVIFRVAVRWRVAIWGIIISVHSVAVWYRVISGIFATLLGMKDEVVGDIKKGMDRWDEDDFLFVATRKFRLSLDSSESSGCSSAVAPIWDLFSRWCGSSEGICDERTSALNSSELVIAYCWCWLRWLSTGTGVEGWGYDVGLWAWPGMSGCSVLRVYRWCWCLARACPDEPWRKVFV